MFKAIRDWLHRITSGNDNNSTSTQSTSAIRGPGKEYAGYIACSVVVVLLAAITASLIYALYRSWPSCECETAGPILAIKKIDKEGQSAGGDKVKIIGTGFLDKPGILFGDKPATDVQSESSTLVTVTTPAHDPGKVNVTLVNKDGRIVTLFNAFNFLSPPTSGTVASAPPTPTNTMKIDTVKPDSGSTEGGDTVIMTGTGFLDVQSVTIAGIPAKISIDSDTTITITTPRHQIGKVDVEIISSSQIAKLPGGFTYACPVPNPKQLLWLVILAGALGGALHSLRSLIWFVGNRELRKSWLPMYFLLPFTGALIGIVFYLIILAGFYTPQNNDHYFLVVGLAALAGMFTQQAAEKLKQIAESVLTKEPPAKDSVAATKTEPTFKIESISPNAGLPTGGTPVTITGRGFQDRAHVRFGDADAEKVVVNVAASTITAVAPPHVEGRVNIEVTNPNTETDILVNGYSYISVTPPSGLGAGGENVVIKGGIFPSDIKVAFDGNTITDRTVSPDGTFITVKSPQHQPGKVEVVVTFPDKKEIRLINGYEYQ